MIECIPNGHESKCDFQEHVVIAFELVVEHGLPYPITICEVNEEYKGLVDPFGRVYTEGKMYLSVDAYKSAVRVAVGGTE